MPRIDCMFAFIAEDSGPDDEGVVAIQSVEGGYGAIWLPLAGADMARVESLKPLAKGIGQVSGRKVKLIKFTQREDLGDL